VITSRVGDGREEGGKRKVVMEREVRRKGEDVRRIRVRGGGC
jgi:hypothetical protein